jgi:hypothetical protein
VIAYRAMLDVPRELVWYVSRLLAAERRARRTRRRARALTSFRQAMFALVWFRKREDLTVLGAGFGISRATAYRYRDEAVDVLAARAPDRRPAKLFRRSSGLPIPDPSGSRLMSAIRALIRLSVFRSCVCQ